MGLLGGKALGGYQFRALTTLNEPILPPKARLTAERGAAP
jgi:hypothetical protein